jgi:hypothetical protein
VATLVTISVGHFKRLDESLYLYSKCGAEVPVAASAAINADTLIFGDGDASVFIMPCPTETKKASKSIWKIHRAMKQYIN